MALREGVSTAPEAEVDRPDKNHIPVIDRMLDILECIELRKNGITIKQLCDALVVPRSTVYRVLNTLEARQVVRRLGGGVYVLGPRLLQLAASVGDDRAPELVQVAAPFLERLARATGESVKFSVIYNDLALVVGAAQGTNEFALTVQTGRTVPLHVGATSKILLANAPEALRERVLSAPHERFTATTITEPDALREELTKVAEAGWADDHGEHRDGVDAVAAAVKGPDGNVAAALSIPYLRSLSGRSKEVLLAQVIRAAEDISAALAAV